MSHYNGLPDGQLWMYCSKCDALRLFKRRPGVALGSGAARRRCTECGHLR